MTILDTAIQAAGSKRALARLLGVSRTTIYKWITRLPESRVRDLEREIERCRRRAKRDQKSA